MGWKETAKQLNDDPQKYEKNDEKSTWHNWCNDKQVLQDVKDANGKIVKKKTEPVTFLMMVKGSYIVQNGRAMGQHAIYGDIEYLNKKDGNDGVEHMLVPQKARSLLLGKDSEDPDIPTLVGRQIIFKDYGFTQNEWVDKVSGKPRKSREFRNVVAKEWVEQK